jgi:hypothetical protein
VADDGGQQRKLDFRTAVEDVKAIASAFSMEAESVLGRRTARLLLWTSAIVAVLAISILIGYPYGITLWDWLMLLIVPAALAIGVYWLNQLQTERERNAQAAQRARELEIESERAKDEALEAYLGHMSQLPLELQSLEDADGNAQELLMQVARARTLTVLQRLDGRRKRSVLQFLFEGGLIERSDPIIGLRGADLSDADLNEALLNETDLREVNLRGADLRDADLRGADLQGADLSEANLSGLSEADLSKTGLGGKQLFLIAGDSLTTTGLRSLGLTNTQMKAQFQGRAKLRDANLRVAVLTEATVTQTQLLLCNSLQSATMPNGQKYEDWLNSTEGKWFYAAWLRKQGAEDGTNGDP